MNTSSPMCLCRCSDCKVNNVAVIRPLSEFVRSAAAAAPAPASPAPTTGRRLRPATTSSSRPLSGVAPRDRIVDQVTPGTISNFLRRPRRIPAQQVHRLAEIHRGLVVLFEEEAEILEERIWEVLESEEEEEREESEEEEEGEERERESEEEFTGFGDMEGGEREGEREEEEEEEDKDKDKGEGERERGETVDIWGDEESDREGGERREREASPEL
ncbi:hypothetical protein NA56DRAFT_694565 [Hyaloscypha hepaticicola]|uniref:Uncharacterized protein n=1 Tax=Hyaloscypha hepaticicola TaxID=2082293 RepID=A0A2J6PI50_9HELO|nr:hypothetical protein NA56DRAFT_694565 [Hyaloscypha hepaticicola]